MIDLRRARAFITAQLSLGMILVSTIMSAHASNCDAALGEQVFAKCTACHSLQAGRGPACTDLMDAARERSKDLVSHLRCATAASCGATLR